MRVKLASLQCVLLQKEKLATCWSGMKDEMPGQLELAADLAAWEYSWQMVSKSPFSKIKGPVSSSSVLLLLPDQHGQRSDQVSINSLSKAGGGRGW